jgi:hypothetical protein
MGDVAWGVGRVRWNFSRRRAKQKQEMAGCGVLYPWIAFPQVFDNPSTPSGGHDALNQRGDHV